MCVLERGDQCVRRRWTAGLDAGRTDTMRQRVQLWTVVWLLLTTLGDGGGRAPDAHQLRVARGFYTFIQPTDVPYRRATTASHCKISVDLADLTTLQVGTVHPHVRLIILFVCPPRPCTVFSLAECYRFSSCDIHNLQIICVSNLY